MMQLSADQERRAQSQASALITQMSDGSPFPALDLAREVIHLRDEVAKRQWRSIETAPKDGAEVLLRSRKGRHADGCYMLDKHGRGFWAWTLIKQEPMYWMPLPEPPS